MSARIYVASLSDYNAGDLYGQWFEASEFADGAELTEAVTEMLKHSPASLRGEVVEEWAIHDYEGFAGIRMSEWEAFDKVVELAHGLSSLEDSEVEAFGVFIEGVAGDIDYFSDINDAIDRFREAFIGELSIEDYAYEYAEDAIGLTGFALQYFDVDKFARDLVIGGDITDTRGFLFHGNW